jgi:hypothetical protein
MNMKFMNKLFKTGSIKDKTSLYLHRPIKEHIELLAERNGVSVSDFVADILDDYLTEYVNAGFLKAPAVEGHGEVPEVAGKIKQQKVEGA